MRLPNGDRTLSSLSLRLHGSFSFLLFQLHTPSLPPPTAWLQPFLHSVTPWLSCCLYRSAKAVLLTDACKRTHALTGAASASQHRVSLAVCRRLPRNARQNSKKPRFHGASARSCQPHPCRETKVHMRVGYVSVQVRTHRTSARGFLGRRTLKHFPLPRHSPIKQTLFITW